MPVMLPSAQTPSGATMQATPVVSLNADGTINSGGSGGGGGGGAVTAIDGALTTIGTTTDPATALTLIGLTKALLNSQAGTKSVTVVGGQLGETLWTDDTGTYFVRLDSGGTVTFYPPAGGSAVTPGTGLRPSGDAATVDKTSYVATTAATGYAVGDLIDHLVAVDRKTGAIVTNQWLNSTQATVLVSAPTAANVLAIGTGTQPVSVASLPLPALAATEATVLRAAVALEASPSSIPTGNNTIGTVNLGTVPTLTIGASALPTNASTDATVTAMSAKLPATLGAKTSALSLSVALATDLSALPIFNPADGTSSLPTLNATLTTSALTLTPNGQAGGMFDVGALAGGAVIVFEQLGTAASTTWDALTVYPVGGLPSTTSTAAAGRFEFVAGGCYQVRARIGTVGTGTVAVSAQLTRGQKIVGAKNASAANFAVNTGLLNSSGGLATVKFAFADLSAAGDLVAAVTGRRIMVLGYTIVAQAAATVRFQSNATTNISSLKAISAGVSVSNSDRGQFMTNVGEKLNMTFAGTGPIGIDLAYIEY